MILSNTLRYFLPFLAVLAIVSSLVFIISAPVQVFAQENIEVPGNPTGEQINNSGGNSFSCNPISPRFDFGSCILTGIAWIYIVIIQIALFFIGVGGLLLDVSLLLSFNMGAIINPSSSVGHAIADGWSVFRDLTNLMFIAGLVWVSIAMILQVSVPGGSNGRFIANIVIAALLVNFSYFFTGAIIDASNTFSKLIYEQGVLSGQSIKIGDTQVQSLPGVVQWILDEGGAQGGTVSEISDSPYLGFIANQFLRETKIITIVDPEALKRRAEANPDYILILIMTLAVVFLVTTIQLFFSMFFTIIARFLILVVLLITSPLIVFRFMGIEPFTEWGKQWWKSLMSQVVFLPVFVFLIAISFKVTGGFFSTLGSTNLSLSGLVSNPNAASFTDAFALAILFIIAWFLLSYSKTVAQNISQGKTMDLPSVAALQAPAAKIGDAIGGFTSRVPRLPIRMITWTGGRGLQKVGDIAEGGAARLRRTATGQAVSRLTGAFRGGTYEERRLKDVARARIKRFENLIDSELARPEDQRNKRALGAAWDALSEEERREVLIKRGQSRKEKQFITEVASVGKHYGEDSAPPATASEPQTTPQYNEVSQRVDNAMDSNDVSRLAESLTELNELERSRKVLDTLDLKNERRDAKQLQREIDQLAKALGKEELGRIIAGEATQLTPQSANMVADKIDESALLNILGNTNVQPDVKDKLVQNAPEESQERLRALKGLLP